MSPPTPLAPGSTIGLLGAGQLGRMTALAAARLGYRVHVYAPDADADAPAGQVAALRTCAAWDDFDALDTFARAVDVVTLEWENVPVATLDRLHRHVSVRPGSHVLAVAQNRLSEKSFANGHGIATAQWRPAGGPGDLTAAVKVLGPDCIVKTTRMGYDGRGQIRLTPDSDMDAAWAALGHRNGPDEHPKEGPTAIVESFVGFDTEISVVVARGIDGKVASYPVVENVHAGGILSRTTAPARVAPAVAAKAQAIAETLAQALQIVGLLAVEMFVLPSGEVLMNEMAPRPHNSGHWTMDGAATCQFEQVVRAVCGLPLGPVTMTCEVEMENLIGDSVNGWKEILAQEEARLHIYGKSDPRPGRKMGHVNRIIKRLP